MDAKELFPEYYQIYLRQVEHPPKGYKLRPEFLGKNGFVNWLESIFETERRLDEGEPIEDGHDEGELDEE